MYYPSIYPGQENIPRLLLRPHTNGGHPLPQLREDELQVLKGEFDAEITGPAIPCFCL